MGRIVARHIREHRYDLVISGNTPTEAQNHILAACRETRAPFVLWIQDFYSIAVWGILAKRIPVIGSLVG
jgi:colanic acid biosynthesis glycosyl transferase WcaI